MATDVASAARYRSRAVASRWIVFGTLAPLVVGPPRDPTALLPIVRGESLQLTEPRQNRAVFEWLRREERDASAMRRVGSGALRDDEVQWVADIDEAIARMMAAGTDEI